MNSTHALPRSLREIQEEVEAEGREWMRQRFKQKLDEEARRRMEILLHDPVLASEPRSPRANGRA